MCSLKIIIFYSFLSFSNQCQPMVSHRSLSDCKFPQVSRALLSILANLNNALVWKVFTHPLISKSSSPCTNLLVTIPRAPIITGITVTFMFYSFFNSLVRSRYLSFFSFSFNLLWLAGTAKLTILQVLFFYVFITWAVLLAKIKWSVCISKSH